MIQEAYCSYKVARLLKEKGFDELCNKKYNGNKNIVSAGKMIELWQNSEFDNDEECSAPTHQMVMRWLREVHNIFIEISTRIDTNGKYHFSYSILDKKCKYVIIGYTDLDWNYEEAVEAALKYVLETQLKSQCTEDDEKEEDK